MVLDLLPTRAGGAAENMAHDFLLLQRYPRETAARFRHYQWREPAFTFGYAQKIADVRQLLPGEGRFDIGRRPTGGGIVDHRDDWTYALVIPRGHPLEEIRATTSYREVHEMLAEALRAQGVPAVTKQRTVALSEDDAAGPGVCFQRAEVFDVVHERSGEKIAGAAQKRNKRGLLFQGSIWRPAVGRAIDWDQFEENFTANLARTLHCAAQPMPWPDLPAEEVSGLVEQYSSPEWLEAR
jgi:lipoate-protein ligase A